MTKETEANKAEAAASAAAVHAAELQTAADEAQKTPEQRKAEEAAQKADDAKAKAAALNKAAEDAAAVPLTAIEAGTLAILSDDVMAGDHMAQKFSNDPANPKGVEGYDPDAKRVKLSIQRLHEGMSYCEVPEKMVGDYERAGWNRVA